MKISARGSGGLCGATECYEIDTTNLENGKKIEKLLARLDVPAAQASVIGADLQRWHITVDDGGCRRSVEFTADGSPASAPWQMLLAEIRAGQA